MLLCFAQNGFESRGESAPVLELLPEGAPAGGGNAVIARAAVVVGGAPVAVDEAGLLEALERRIERALVHFENTPGDLIDALADPPPMHGREGECLEHEQVEGAAEGVALRFDSHGFL